MAPKNKMTNRAKPIPIHEMRGLVALLAVLAVGFFSQTEAQLANPGGKDAAAKDGGLGGGLRCDPSPSPHRNGSVNDAKTLQNSSGLHRSR